MTDSTIKGPPLADDPLFGPLTLGGFFREVCRRNGDREAMVFHPPGGKPVVRYTYRKMYDEAFAVAQALVARGVAKETRVGLLATNRPEWVIAMFGIALAGGTCVALSTFAKTGELDYMLRMGDVSILIFERSILNRDFAAELIELCPEIAAAKDTTLSPRLPFLRSAVCIDDAPAPRGAFESWRDFVRSDRKAPAAIVDAIDAEVAPTDRALVMFSSGSTAKPKAVLQSHRAATIQGWRWRAILAIDPDVRSWAANGFFWSGNFAQVMAATLAAGGCLVLQRFFDPAEALRLMQIERVTYPAAWPHQWARLVEEPSYATTDLSSVHYVGESSALRTHPTVKTDWDEPWAAYGNTETFTLSSAHYSGTPKEVSAGNHGFPLHENTFRIIDPLTGTVLDRNEAGEICVKGPTMMLGYLRVPAEDSFDAEGFFRTGDGGFIDDQGRLHWHGRLNDIIKTGGANVSPLESDAVLRTLPGVKVVATVGVPHDTLGELVVACVVPEEGVTLDEKAVIAFAAKQLSSYKVPRKVVFIEESDVTLTSSNKVKTAPLRELAAKRLAAG
jgi:acyl-CoA synthetase (AMP-forming)/AMP-acid ligase II